MESRVWKDTRYFEFKNLYPVKILPVWNITEIGNSYVTFITGWPHDPWFTVTTSGSYHRLRNNSYCPPSYLWVYLCRIQISRWMYLCIPLSIHARQCNINYLATSLNCSRKGKLGCCFTLALYSSGNSSLCSQNYTQLMRFGDNGTCAQFPYCCRLVFDFRSNFAIYLYCKHDFDRDSIGPNSITALQ